MNLHLAFSHDKHHYKLRRPRRVSQQELTSQHAVQLAGEEIARNNGDFTFKNEKAKEKASIPRAENNQEKDDSCLTQQDSFLQSCLPSTHRLSDDQGGSNNRTVFRG